MYKSPVEIICGDIQKQIDNDIYRVVQKYDIKVDKNELIQALQYDRDQYEKGYADGKDDATPRWIPVTERLPESGVHVLVACEMRGQYLCGQYVCDGYYAKAKTQPSYGNPDECAVEYSEEDDEYYLLEGWYEVIKNWDDFNSIVIDDFVTHWMPLPEPPKGE